ncbi:MAG: PepSY domain-containing protein [Mariprofundaceae bacterium]|nr:PepSY domain-containing protein [Mariprofundaceae bacterium]
MGRLTSPLRCFAATVFITVVAAMPLAIADDDIDHIRVLRSTESILPLSQILKKIEASHPGTLLDVELEDKGTQFIYEIEMLNANHVVQEIKVDATTGKIVTTEDD